MKKILLSGLMGGLALLILSISGLYILLWLLPDMAMEYFGPAFISTPNRSILYYIHPFIISTGLSWLWHQTGNVFKGRPIIASLKFGIAYMSIATLPYMLLVYSAINISLPVMCTWLAFGFIEAVVAATIFNTLNRS